jgi:ribulose-phosphate 3-epimerase
MAEQMAEAERGGASLWHLDIMDGHFVPNLSYGPHVCAGLRKYTSLPIDAHLMVKNPSRFTEPFLRAGAAFVTLHAEVADTEPIPQLLCEIKKAGATPGISLNPKTPLEAVAPYFQHVGLVLLMSVEPGYGGQAFIPESIGRLRELRAMINRADPDIILQIDGGVTLENAKAAAEAGADILVAGSAVFAAPDIEKRCRAFMELF